MKVIAYIEKYSPKTVSRISKNNVSPKNLKSFVGRVFWQKNTDRKNFFKITFVYLWTGKPDEGLSQSLPAEVISVSVPSNHWMVTIYLLCQ